MTSALQRLLRPQCSIIRRSVWPGIGWSPSSEHTPEQAASVILAIGGMGCFWIGRLFGSYILKFIRPEKLLAVYAAINTLLMIVVVLKLGWPSVVALFSCYFFMSVMFPTIFALGLRGLGPLTKGAASFLVMAVAGGAFCPPLMGLIADHAGMPVAFLVPMGCFAFIAYYAFSVIPRPGNS